MQLRFILCGLWICLLPHGALGQDENSGQNGASETSEAEVSDDGDGAIPLGEALGEEEGATDAEPSQEDPAPVAAEESGADPVAEGALNAEGAEGPGKLESDNSGDSEATPSEPFEKPSEPASAAEEAPGEGGYNLKLRDIETRVNELKEKIFQSKARLIQLQEVVLQGTVTGSKLVLIHRNEMGSSFRLWRVQYALDGAPLFNRVDSGSGELNDEEEIEIFSGAVAPGNHQLSVYLEYNGNGWGVFSYLKGYKFKIKSGYTFVAEEGKTTTVRIVGYEKGGITAQLQDRPAVDYRVEVAKELRESEEDISDE